MLSLPDATELLARHGQGHVLRFWDCLAADQRTALLEQIDGIDMATVARMRDLLRSGGTAAARGDIEPAPVLRLADAERAAPRAAGVEALRAGRVGVLLVAGGQGSRLGFDGPKGAFPIGPISGASLFEIHARKVLALRRRYGAPLPFYVMTSRENHAATIAFFRERGHFGLDPADVVFFSQGMWPALFPDGRLVMDRPDHLFRSPDGHGGVLSALEHNGSLDDMVRRGLRTLFYFQVDNPLVEIADPVFLGVHERRNADMSVKVCAKRDPDEGLGVVVRRNGRSAVVEYTELTREQKLAEGPDGRLRFLFGSVAIHAFSLDFLRREAKAGLPLHVAFKRVPFCDEAGRTVKPDSPNAYKFEKFIFDALPDAGASVCLAFSRDEEFSPVKNARGDDSPLTAGRDLTRKFARRLEACDVAVPRDPAGEPAVRIEIDPCYALDAEELRGRLPPGFRVGGDVWLR